MTKSFCRDNKHHNTQSKIVETAFFIKCKQLWLDEASAHRKSSQYSTTGQQWSFKLLIWAELEKCFKNGFKTGALSFVGCSKIWMNQFSAECVKYKSNESMQIYGFTGNYEANAPHGSFESTIQLKINSLLVYCLCNKMIYYPTHLEKLFL